MSREEIRAHLANVESQVKAALRVIASESKGTQQAHSALRADLSSALVRLQADMNGSSSDIVAKLDRLGAEVSFLSRQRRISRIIFTTFGMTLSFILGVLVIAGWLLVKEGVLENLGIPLPIEEMMRPEKLAPKASGAQSLHAKPARPAASQAVAPPLPAKTVTTPPNPPVAASAGVITPPTATKPKAAQQEVPALLMAPAPRQQ